MPTQFTQEFTRWDGKKATAVIRTRKVKHGYVGIIKIGDISQTVTATHCMETNAQTVALRILTNYRENAVV